MTAPGNIPHHLTFDVEEYFQVEAAGRCVNRRDWDRLASRLREPVDRILDLLGRASARATFFVLGSVARRDGDLVRRIASAGHEIASHGMSHHMLGRLTPRSFAQELRDSRRLLEDLAGQAVVGFRAPTFSITHATAWALEVLADEGWLYDSSIFPVRHDRYGVPDAPRDPHWACAGRAGGAGDRAAGGTGATAGAGDRAASGTGTAEFSGGACSAMTEPRVKILELPPLTSRTLGVNWPVGGGGYLRLLPAWVVARSIAAAQRRGQPAMIYLHPWELDPAQPVLPMGRLGTWRHRVNLHRTADKLQRLLTRFRFTAVRDNLPALRTADLPTHHYGK